MKLIIDIPDTTYALVKQLQGLYIGRGNLKTVQQTVINAIKFGKPQPQGKWIIRGCRQDCSHCGFTFSFDMGADNFCPNCGAQMRGEEE